jgi:putative Mg2+ transporter-C (MgtC) family protein
MTGIGFLGDGGIIVGIGFHGAAISATVLALTAMTALGKAEKLLPYQTTLHLSLVYPKHLVPTSAEISECMQAYGFEILDWTYQYSEAKRQFHFDLVIQASGPYESSIIARDLSSARDVTEFRLAPSRA